MGTALDTAQCLGLVNAPLFRGILSAESTEAVDASESPHCSWVVPELMKEGPPGTGHLHWAAPRQGAWLCLLSHMVRPGRSVCRSLGWSALAAVFSSCSCGQVTYSGGLGVGNLDSSPHTSLGLSFHVWNMGQREGIQHLSALTWR